MRRCADCGTPTERWALVCSACARPAENPTHIILLTPSSLRFRIVHCLKELAGIAVVLVGVFVALVFLNWLLITLFESTGDAIARVLTVIVGLLAFLAALVTLGQIYDILRRQGLADIFYKVDGITAKTSRFVNYTDSRKGRIVDFDENFVSLKEITAIRLSRSFVGRLLNYGNISFCIGAPPAEALTFEGIARPLQFIERVQAIINRLR